MFYGFLQNLTYKNGEEIEFLNAGIQTQESDDIVQIVKKVKSNDSALISILRILELLNTRLKYQDVQDIKFTRTASQIWESGFITGCSDFTLIFETMTRQCHIPTIHLQTVNKKFVEELQSGTQRGVRGHHFCECFVNEKWILVDSTRNKILQEYNPLDLNINQYYVFSKSTDIFETGIYNLYENNEKIRELFRSFDLTNFHKANEVKSSEVVK